MLIDTSYFFGDCSIGQLSEAAVQGKLSWFIQQYEPEYLQGVLGYKTMKEFLDGLNGGVIDPIWTNLLTGVEYTDVNGRPRKWRGLVQVPQGSAYLNYNTQIVVTVGGTGSYDPPVGMTATIPAALVGSTFTLVYRAFGPLILGENYTVNGDVLTLISPMAFKEGDKYFYYGNSVSVTPSTAFQTAKLSPIAYYVYYNYMRSQISNTGGTGEAILDNDNATNVSPGIKMASAYNKMVHINRELFDFLFTNQASYPDWLTSVYQGYGLYGAYRTDSAAKFLTTINTFGI